VRVPADELTISTVEYGPFHEYVPSAGTVVPKITHYLTATEGGRVEGLFSEIGSLVEEGDAILSLTNTDLLMSVMYREAELVQQSNNLRSARILMEQHQLSLKRELLSLERRLKRQKRDVDNYAALLERDLIAVQDYQEAADELEFLEAERELLLETQEHDLAFREAQLDQLDASLERMEANLDLVRANLEGLTVRAPIAGQLTALNASIGESKGRGERLGQIDVLDGFRVRSSVDQGYIGRVTAGLPASMELGDETYDLVVDRVHPEVVNGSFEILMSFPGEQPERLRRGQTVHLKIELGEPYEALLLPNGAHRRATGGRWVYVVDADGSHARRRDVTIPRRNSEFCEVAEGLEPGERVITSDYDWFGDADVLVITD
jgi:HlyD family secretion protein